MPQTPESKVKQKIKKVLDKYNVYYFFPIGGPYGRRGIPDIVGCANGRFFAIEVKSAGRSNTVTQLQKRELLNIEFNGGIAMIVVGEDSINAVDKIMERLCHEDS